ncbi:myelin-oligodendrocyte glycoprotein-like isoform 2-T3 [Pholidichthys leucotaenia]
MEQDCWCDRWSRHRTDTTAPGVPRVIGSTGPVRAVPGEDVILPCHLEPVVDVEGLTVEWSKPDLKPDPSDPLNRVEYVHLYRDRKELVDMKMALYFGRTDIFSSELKHGNISLKIMNVTEDDNGRFKCYIPKLQSKVKFAVIQLIVDPNHDKTSITQTPPPGGSQTPGPDDQTLGKGGRSRVATLVSFLMCALAVLGLSMTLLITHLCHKQNEPEPAGIT